MDWTGQYLAAAVRNGYVFVSTDYGVTFTVSISLAYSWFSSFTSQTGQYVYLIQGTTASVYSSSNYASSFTNSTATAFRGATGLATYTVTCDSTGNILLYRI